MPRLFYHLVRGSERRLLGSMNLEEALVEACQELKLESVGSELAWGVLAHAGWCVQCENPYLEADGSQDLHMISLMQNRAAGR